MLLKESIKLKSQLFYHGDSIKFDEFTLDYINGNTATDQNGYGLYFTDNLDEAYIYGDYIYEVKLTGNFISEEEPINRVSKSFLTRLIKSNPDWKDTAYNWSENPTIGLSLAINDLYEYCTDAKDILLQVQYDWFRYQAQEFCDTCSTLGIDGIIAHNSNIGSKQVVVYNLNAIDIIDVRG